jgi:hypothetical protein
MSQDKYADTSATLPPPFKILLTDGPEEKARHKVLRSFYVNKEGTMYGSLASWAECESPKGRRAPNIFLINIRDEGGVEQGLQGLPMVLFPIIVHVRQAFELTLVAYDAIHALWRDDTEGQGDYPAVFLEGVLDQALRSNGGVRPVHP